MGGKGGTRKTIMADGKNHRHAHKLLQLQILLSRTKDQLQVIQVHYKKFCIFHFKNKYINKHAS